MKSAIQTTDFHIPKKIIRNILASLMLTSIGTAHADGVFLKLFSARLQQDTKSTQLTDALLLDDGTIAVADNLNSSIKIFNRNGDYIRSFGEYGNAFGKITGIISLAKGKDGRINVADRGNKRIHFFSKEGNFIQHFGPGPFFEPASSYYDASTDLIYAVNRSSHKVEVYNSKGQSIQEIGGYDDTNHDADGKLYNPLSFFVDKATNTIYVSDSGNDRISVFTTSGQFLYHMGNVDGPTKLNTPNKIYKTVKGDIYVADVMNHRIQIFKNDGTDGGQIGSQGQNPGQFLFMSSFDIDETTGNIFIADTGNQRVQNFFDPNLWNKPGTASFNDDIDLAQPLTVKNGQTLAVNSGTFRSQTLNLETQTTLDHTSSAKINIDGDVVFAGGSTYLFRYDDSQPIRGLQATGKAYVDGEIAIENGYNIPLNTKFAFFTADQGVVGGFDTSKTNTALLRYNLSYDANNVYIEVTRLALKDVLGKMNSNLHTVIDNNYNNINPQSRFGIFTKRLGRLKLAEQISAELIDLQPGYFHGVTAAATNNSSLMKNAVNSELAARRHARTITTSLSSFTQVSSKLVKGLTTLINLRPTTYNQFTEQLSNMGPSGKKPILHGVETKTNLPKDARSQMGQLGIWLQTSGQFFDQKSMSNTVGVHSKTTGLSAGIDCQLTKETLLGVAFGVTGNKYHLADHNGKGKINSTFIGTYGSWTPSNSGLFIDASAFVGLHSFKGNRVTATPIDKLTQKHHGLEFTANSVIGYDIALPNNFHLQPYMEGTLTNLKENGYKEHDSTGSAFQKISSRTSKFLRADTGVELSKIIVSETLFWRPSVKLGYAHRQELGNGNKAKVELMDLPGQPYTIVSNKCPHSLVTAGAALTVMSGKSMYMTFSYNGDYGKQSKTHTGLLRFGWMF